MNSDRSGGILVHPTSFPGKFGIGDIGPNAFEFIDFLSASGMGLWQVLPLNPTGYGDSPYQSFSAFAGNPYIISPEALHEDGLISRADLANHPDFHADRVDFGAVIPWKTQLLNIAYSNFHARRLLQEEFESFVKDERSWLADYAVFIALKEKFGGAPWVDWPPEFRERDAQALSNFGDKNAADVMRHSFIQFLFFQQWKKLREYARANNVRIIGDIPIYVAHDSSDVWGNPELFELDDVGKPTVLAGVPPDYFSKFGQLWGNPIYRWGKLAERDYDWWKARVRAALNTVDVIRLDHFRGFAGYWEVPAGELTAVRGRWVPGPGAALFAALEQDMGKLPIIAEDLGEITPDVIELREQFGFPGMKILQFGFSGDPDHEFLPHMYPENCVAYTGTHDNETAVGWYQNATEENRQTAREYLGADGKEIHWALIEALWASPARLVLAQMQDFLGVGDAGRMNFPSAPAGNWQWRFHAGMLTDRLADRVRKLGERTGRLSN
ncbi:MAG: 4-alpha-glucanotransferase [Chloroflexi bacterium]|nr:4-alpha-glucanotransferase [Chloroflexota bacterium]